MCCAGQLGINMVFCVVGIHSKEPGFAVVHLGNYSFALCNKKHKQNFIVMNNMPSKVLNTASCYQMCINKAVISALRYFILLTIYTH
jgi:hypothetical protein